MNSSLERARALALPAAIVAATLTTAYIHFTLGGLLFLLNAIGYVVLAGLVIAPVGFIARLRPLVLWALAGYTTATIVGWAIMGPYFQLAYITKAVEVGLLVLIGAQLYITRADFVPSLRFLRAIGWEALRIVSRRPAAAPADTATAAETSEG